LVAVGGAPGEELLKRFSRIPNARRAAIVREENGEVWARIHPVAGSRNGELVRSVLAAANGWKVEEIRTEEGRLDEVFRNITLPDTVKPE
jgi:ABC-2 type transport system ATP-binding protein